jgi:hypothetical protein
VKLRLKTHLNKDSVPWPKMMILRDWGCSSLVVCTLHVQCSEFYPQQHKINNKMKGWCYWESQISKGFMTIWTSKPPVVTLIAYVQWHCKYAWPFQVQHWLSRWFCICLRNPEIFSFSAKWHFNCEAISIYHRCPFIEKQQLSIYSYSCC